MDENSIIKTATALFAKKGINSVSIWQIAADASVSENEMGKAFAGKEQLIEACVGQEVKNLETDINDAVLQTRSSLERIIAINLTVFSRLSVFCAAFYKELRAYPSAQKRFISFRENLQCRFIGYFKECEIDGFFAPDYNMESSASICIEAFSNMKPKFQAKVIRLFLKSICTEKGAAELKRIESECNLFINNK